MAPVTRRVAAGSAERRLTHRLPFPDRRPTVGGDTERVPTRSAHVFVTDARTRRRTFIAFLTATVALTLLVGPTPATAASKSCADQVVADWYGDGRVDRIFPLHCYQEAIRSLPVDVLDYSNAKEDILRALQKRGVRVRAYDPVVREGAAGLPARVIFAENAYDAAKGADALVIVTEWNEFRKLDLARIRRVMRRRAIVDLRNIYDPASVQKLGFDYTSVGRRHEAD